MKLITLTIIAVLLVCLASPSTEKSIKCGVNEEPTVCVSCMPTCKNPTPGICHGPICRPGCKCKQGFYKDSEGNCVSPMNCTKDETKG